MRGSSFFPRVCQAYGLGSRHELSHSRLPARESPQFDNLAPHSDARTIVHRTSNSQLLRSFCAMHASCARPDVLRKDGSTPLTHQMPVFAMSVKHTVEIDVTVVEFFDKLVILVDPVRVPGFLLYL